MHFISLLAAAWLLFVPPIPPSYQGDTFLVPWLEVNDQGSETISRALRGLKAWRPFCMEVIVTTRLGKRQIYQILKRAADFPMVNSHGDPLPPIRIIPGIKPLELKELGDEAGWKKVAKDVLPMLRETWSSTFVFELETVIGRHQSSGLPRVPVNWKGLRQGLGYLPKSVLIYGRASIPINYVLYPSDVLQGNSIYRQNDAIWKSVFGDRVCFVDHHFYKADLDLVEHRDFLAGLGCSFPLLYMYDGLSWSWDFDEVREAIARTGEPGRKIIYPGAERFERSAVEIGQSLWPD